MLITRSDGAPITGMLDRLIANLEKKGFLIAHLARSQVSHDGVESYMGVCRLPGEN